MNKKIILFALIAIMAIGCKNKLSDPLNGFIIGSSDSTWRLNVEKLLDNKIFINEQNGGEFDSYILIKSDTLPVKAYINYDKFYFGKLLEYRISLNGDTGNAWGSIYYKKGAGYQRFEVVKKVYNLFVDEFGKPDITESVSHTPTMEDVIRTMNGDTSGPLRNDILLKSKKENTVAKNANFISTWKLKTLNIVFHCDPISYLRDSIPRVENSYISFMHINYDSEIKFIKDSLIKSYTAKDYVKFNVESCEIAREPTNWDSPYDRSIKFLVQSIARGANEDPKDVELIKYDIFVYDSFENELFSFPDNSWNLSEPLTPNSTLMMMGSPGWELSTKYRSSAPSLANLEKAFGSGEKLFAKFEVKALRFTDGSILK